MNINLSDQLKIRKLLNHQGILEMNEYFKINDDTLLVVNENVSGLTLYRKVIIQNQSLSEIDCSIIIFALLDTINYCSDKGIVFSNLNPFNIIYEHPSVNDILKLMNFQTAVMINQNLDNFELIEKKESSKEALSYKGQSVILNKLSSF